MQPDSPQKKSSSLMLWIIVGIAVLGVLKATGVLSGLPAVPC